MKHPRLRTALALAYQYKVQGKTVQAREDARAMLVPKEMRCQQCGGTGNMLLSMYKKCDRCDGTGHKDKKPIWPETPTK